MITVNDFSDMVRGMTVALYGVVIFQVFYILYHYFRVVRMERKIQQARGGLLPRHVLFLGFSLMGFATECVAQNVLHLGHHITYFTVINPILLAITVWGLHLVMIFEYRRYTFLLDNDLNPHG